MSVHPSCLAVLALCAGCPSFTTVGSARTLDAHRIQWVAGVGSMLVQDPVADPSEHPNLYPAPNLETGLRYGVTDTVEIGAKVWGIGTQVDAKLALVRSQSPDDGLEISINPAVSVEGDPADQASSSSLYATALIGYRWHGHELLVVPGLIERFVSRTWDEDTLHGRVLYARFAIAVGIQVTPSLRIQPELGVVYPFNPESSLGVGFASAAPAASIGFIIGRERAR